MNSIGLQLREARQRAGLNTAHVAERMGVTRQMVCRLERDDSNPTVSTLERYAAAINGGVEVIIFPIVDLVCRQEWYRESGPCSAVGPCDHSEGSSGGTGGA